jgi:hypothetical protein
VRQDVGVRDDTWARLTATVPWLADLPPRLTQALDLGELMVPEGVVASARADLEHILNHHVMTYRAGAVPRPGRTQLCTILTPAVLSPRELELLQQAESSLAQYGVVLCAYAR